MQKKTLSIIIPCYKIDLNQLYLQQLLSRLSNQEDSKFSIIEVILINDSPNLSIEKFIKTDIFSFNIKIYNNSKNSGQAFSRNYGFEVSSGEYIHFIDQDDLLSSNFYASIQTLSDIIIANCQIFNDKYQMPLYKSLRQEIYKKNKYLNKLKYFLLFDNIILSPGQAIFNRGVLDNLTRFPILENYGSDDYGFMYTLTMKKLQYTFSENSFFLHRLHAIQGKNFLNLTKSRKEFFNRFYKNKNIFSFLCKTEKFSILRKLVYILFNNRFKKPTT